MSRRRTTIHDAAALRVHPSGERARAAGIRAKHKRPVRDARGNLLAPDAGGGSRVVRREEKKDARARRRVAFEADVALPRVPAPAHAQPSADLLKCVHYYASRHYEQQGQLVDAASVYRREKKARRLRRLQRLTEEAAEGEEEDEEDEEEGEEEGEEADNDDGEEEGEVAMAVRPEDGLRKDMYKAFDGSALLCIGMLLQAHIVAALAKAPPDAWADSDADSDAGPPSAAEAA